MSFKLKTRIVNNGWDRLSVEIDYASTFKPYTSGMLGYDYILIKIILVFQSRVVRCLKCSPESSATGH